MGRLCVCVVGNKVKIIGIFEMVDMVILVVFVYIFLLVKGIVCKSIKIICY